MFFINIEMVQVASCIFNTMVADALVTQGAKASAAMVLG